MIIISFDGRWNLTARGHAGLAPVGHDLLCAAVSALTDAYCAYCCQCGAALHVRQGPGLLEVQVSSVPRQQRRALDAARQMTRTGLRRLQQGYPDRVRVISP